MSEKHDIEDLADISRIARRYIAVAKWIIASVAAAVAWQVTTSMRLKTVEGVTEATASRVGRIEREGTELSRQDHQRLVVVERRQEATEAALADIQRLLARIDENVKSMKEQRKQ